MLKLPDLFYSSQNQYKEEDCRYLRWLLAPPAKMGGSLRCELEQEGFTAKVVKRPFNQKAKLPSRIEVLAAIKRKCKDDFINRSVVDMDLVRVEMVA